MLSFNHTTPRTSVANQFEAISEDDEDIPELKSSDSEVECAQSVPQASKELLFLNMFAHHVHQGKTLSQRAAAKRNHSFRTHGVLIKSEADLAKPEVQHMIQALLQDKLTLRRLAKLCPTDAEEFGQGEYWCLLDTGSTVSAMKVQRTLPDYAHLVKPVPDNKKSKSAETACGGKVKFDAQIELTGHIEGELHTMVFNDMDVTMPIASMRESVHRGNELRIKEGGGTVENMKSGKVVILQEREGVYFLKMSLLPPQLQQRYAQLGRTPNGTVKPKKMVFSRPA